MLSGNNIPKTEEEITLFCPNKQLFPLTPLKQRLNLFFSGALSCVGGRVMALIHMNAKVCLISFFLFIPGYFWHITDLHFDSAYSTKGDIVRSRFKLSFNDEKLIDLQFYEKHVKAFIQLGFIDFSACAVHIVYVCCYFCDFYVVFLPLGRKERSLGQPQRHSQPYGGCLMS